jgi:transcriptional regulator with XRE-family HTH domain
MSKPILQYAKESAMTSSNDSSNADARRSPLAALVSQRLREKNLRQVDFCRQTGFDQGLLSKILSSVVNTLNVESALKLAEGLNIPASVVFEVIGKKEVDEMLRRFYCDSNRVM